VSAIEFCSDEAVFHGIEAIKGSNRSSSPLFDRIGRGHYNELQIRMINTCSLFLPAADLATGIDLRESTQWHEEKKSDVKQFMSSHSASFLRG